MIRIRIWDRWEEVFDDFTAEIEEYIDAGESVVTVLAGAQPAREALS